MKRTLSKVLFVVVALLVSVSCGSNKAKKVVLSKVPVKNEVMGLRLGQEASQWKIESSFAKAAGGEFMSYEQAQGKCKAIRTSTYLWNFQYGGTAWTYADVMLDEKNRVYDIEFCASYEDKDSAKKQYDLLKANLVQKYGEYNTIQAPDKNILEWTDGVTSIGLTLYKSSTQSGENRFFCTLFYLDDVLYNAFVEQNVPDL